jgi:hypothetical protein
LDARKTCWLTDLSGPDDPYIYRLDSYIYIHIRIYIHICIYIHLHIHLHWYEPLSWYRLCIFLYETPTAYKPGNGPETADGAETHDADTQATGRVAQSAQNKCMSFRHDAVPVQLLISVVGTDNGSQPKISSRARYGLASVWGQRNVAHTN